MQILNISHRKFETLKPLELPRNVLNTIIMIFNFFLGSNIRRLSISKFYLYLTKIPYKYLERLQEFYGRTHKNTFELFNKNSFNGGNYGI